MRMMEFAVEMKASRERVWETLWKDENFRQWASVIDPETYMVGELRVGNEVQFISAANGYGVTSLVEELWPGEYLLLRHQKDIKEGGRKAREKEWTGGEESYRLEEEEGNTTLTVRFEVPGHLEEYFGENYPKALAKVKELAESE